MKIKKGIYSLKMPMPKNPLGFVNVYVFTSKGTHMIVDTGLNIDEGYQVLVDQLKNIGVGLSDLDYVALTHAHPDHCGLASRLIENSAAKLIIHQVESAFLSELNAIALKPPGSLNSYSFQNGMPQDKSVNLTQSYLMQTGLSLQSLPTWLVQEGDHIKIGDFDLEVFWTPGHSPGHICLYERELGILVSGDTVLPGITPNIGGGTTFPGIALVNYLDSLRKLRMLPVTLVLPAHGEIFSDLEKRIDEILYHHEQREAQVLAALNGQRKTAYQIASQVTWNTDGERWEDLSSTNTHFAVAETIAHLEKLCTEGKAERVEEEGVYNYVSMY